MRMDVDMFQELLARVSPRITKCHNNRLPICPGLKIAVTLCFVATGNSYASLAYSFRVAHNTISLFVPEVCDAIVEEYRQQHFATPSNPDEWRDVADKFSSRWNLPHTCGALDGKHVAIRKPPRAGSRYYNYKGFHSIVIMALVDAEYKFLWANVGAEGARSDAAIFQVCSLRLSLQEGTLGLPPAEPLPGDDRDTPFFIVGDDAFPLRHWLQKPFSLRDLTHDKRVYNYRLSRARRVVENAFGILASTFRVLLTTLHVLPDNGQSVTKGYLVLHNILRTRYPNLRNEDVDQDVDGMIVPGSWRNVGVLDDCQREGSTGERCTRQGRELRLYLMHYFNSQAGKVPWQEAAIRI
ncbi:HARBI1 [Branchiostoma lanceolatum]|uniref:HARBI1 protein n=1 Tax=Branchiostoma lanceolatum TaxID=7740 RepID=A0A8K0A0K6_BRALA|nr:HARBI1 [Branchiostoma lanceolatum]